MAYSQRTPNVQLSRMGGAEPAHADMDMDALDVYMGAVAASTHEALDRLGRVLSCVVEGTRVQLDPASSEELQRLEALVLHLGGSRCEECGRAGGRMHAGGQLDPASGEELQRLEAL